MVKLKAAARATPSRPFTLRQVGQDEADEVGVEVVPWCLLLSDKSFQIYDVCLCAARSGVKWSIRNAGEINPNRAQRPG